MTPEFKKKWIDALRSGKYKQGTDFLCTKNGYCCLGIAILECGYGFTDDGYVINKNGYVIKKGGDIIYENKELPDFMQDLLDLDRCGTIPNLTTADGKSRYYNRDRNTYTLADLNDYGCTFNQIADVIEYFF